MFATINKFANDWETPPAGPYTAPTAASGNVIRHERVENVYRLRGTGKVPQLDPSDPVSCERSPSACFRAAEWPPLLLNARRAAGLQSH